jgi:hypothetical protein
MPIHFEFNDSYKFPDTPGLKSYMEKSDNSIIQKYLKAIIANGEKQLGAGLAAVVFLIGKNSVCYLTTDEDKHRYLKEYLHITNEKMFPYTKIKMKSWDTEKDKWVYVFGADRLFLVEELADPLKELWEGRIRKMMDLYRELRKDKGKEIFIVADPELFVEFCDLLAKKDSTWKKSLTPIKRWAEHEGHQFPDVILDLKSANVLFKTDGSVAYIADPLSHTASASIAREELLGKVSLSKEQKRDILDLMTDYLTEDMSIKQLRHKLSEIQEINYV